MEVLIDVKEFKLISRQFRRVAGDFLNSEDTYETMRLATRFVNFIDSQPIIADFISKNNQFEYDMKSITTEKSYNEKFDIPIEVDKEVAFIYQLLKYSTANFERFDTISRAYAFYSGAKISDSIRVFNREVVKLLVNHITDYLEEKAIDMGIDDKPDAKILVQGNVGQLNFANTGDIQANQQTNNNNGNEDLTTVAKDLIELLKEANIENSSLKEDAIDFIEESTDIIEAGGQPKPSLLRRTKDSLGDLRAAVDDGTSLAMKIDKAYQLFGNIQI